MCTELVHCAYCLSNWVALLIGLLGIANIQDRISSSIQQSDKETMDVELRYYHREWLGNLSRMTNYHFSIICLLAGCLIPIYFVDPEDDGEISQIVV